MTEDRRPLRDAALRDAALRDAALRDAMIEAPGRENLGHLLWETTTHWLAFTEPALEGTHLGPSSTGTLGTISACPGITASELSRHAGKTQQAVSQMTGRLERLGYIERRVGRGRGVGLHVTPAGERALTEGLALEDTIEQQARTLFGEELYAQLKARLLQARDLLIAASE